MLGTLLTRINESPFWRQSVSVRGMRLSPPTLDRWVALQAHRFGLMGVSFLRYEPQTIFLPGQGMASAQPILQPGGVQRTFFVERFGDWDNWCRKDDTNRQTRFRPEVQNPPFLKLWDGAGPSDEKQSLRPWCCLVSSSSRFIFGLRTTAFTRTIIGQSYPFLRLRFPSFGITPSHNSRPGHRVVP
jgi:hypothetical protein